ncbi:MAG: hypothetical protein NT093_04180 [Candidatus Moranbacteria bacterium]|nr:hypothetical protein [Candidatus Moranbacteria bacterium]
MLKTKTKIIAGFLALSFCLPVFAASRNVSGVLGGKKKKYSAPLNDSTYQTLFNLPELYCRDYGFTDFAACYNFLNYDRADQKEALAPLVNWLNKKIKKSDDRVRVAASLVQNIPYDYNKSTGTEVIPSGRDHGVRYPYEVLQENAGICGEKASLIVFLLKQLGYGTATITFTSPAVHEVAGVKCPPAYDFRDTGYCFIDPNYRHMITFGGSYEDHDPYRVLVISDGKTLNAKNDWKDSRNWWKVLREGTRSNKNYKLYKKLVKKYGL